MNKLKSFYRFIKPFTDTVVIIGALLVLSVMLVKDEITNKDIIITIYCSLVLVWWEIDNAVIKIKKEIENIFEDEEEIEEEITNNIIK